MSETNLNKKGIINLTPKELLFKYLPFLPWVALSLLIFVAGSYLKLRYSTPIYNVYGKLLVKDKDPYGGNGADKLSSLLMLPDDNNNLNNEIEIIRSRSMAARVIRSLGLTQQYAQKGSIRTSQTYVKDMPFEWVIDKLNDTIEAFDYEIIIVNAHQFQLNNNPETYNFGQVINTPQSSFRLIPIQGMVIAPSPQKYILTHVPEELFAINLSSSLGIERKEGASVLTLSYLTENKKIGLDIINTYMREYQLSSLEDKKLIAATTANFINEQLDTLQKELGGVERNLQDFREKNKLFSAERQADIVFDQMSLYNTQINEQSVKSKVLDYMIRYMKDVKNRGKLVPSNLGIEEPSLISQITEYNALQLKKETLLKTTTSENSLVVGIETSIEKTRQDILENLANVKEAYNLKINQLNQISNQTNSSISSIPGKEKQLLEVTRRQTILQELYSFLLQKKVETGISSASTLSDIKMLEPALAGSVPVSPNKMTLYTIAVFFGLLIPIIIIFLKEYLNDKVTSKNDISKVTLTPIVGEIGHVEDTATLIVRHDNRSYVAEQFRIIRSNLRYLGHKTGNPVILITSSFSGEGKSFISTNLAAALALSGKKTVILEMDIRKPKILKGLGMEKRVGLTNYLISNISVSSIIYNVPDVENLSVIPCGPIPPNPAELLLDSKVEVLFEELKKTFDAIIVDTAPVGLVSDAVTLGAYCNTTIYIVRHDYTLKRQIPMIDAFFVDGKLPQLSIVINDIKSEKAGYYGYGYGFGASKREGGYFGNESKKKRFNLFKP